MKRFASLVLFILMAVSVPRVARAMPPTDCTTPRRATDSVFAWQQPGQKNLELASMCLDGAGRTQRELEQIATEIFAVYNAKLAYVDMEAISDAPSYTDGKGKPRIVPHPLLPDVVVEKDEASGNWQWSRHGLDVVHAIHATEGVKLHKRFVDSLPEGLKGTVFGVAHWQYIALLLVFVLGLVLRTVIQAVVLGRVRKMAAAMGQSWMLRLADVVASPAATLVVAGLLALAYPELGLPIGAALTVAVIVRLLLVLSVVWACYRAVDVLAERMAVKASITDTKLDDQLVPLVRKSLKVVVVLVGILFGLQNINVNVGSLLAGLGIGGLAFALAAKDTLANFFGSVMIFVDRPFQIGDWIQAAGVEGIVEEVGFRSTRVRTFANSLVTVPNSKLMDANIENYGAREYRRSVSTLNLTLDTTPEQVQAFCEGVRAIIQANPHTRKDYYEVHVSGLGAHSIDVMLYYFFKVGSWSEELAQRHNVSLEILRLAQALQVEFAFPTQTLMHDYVRSPGEARPAPRAQSVERLGEIVRAFGPKGERARPGGPKITERGYLATPEAAGSASDAAEAN